MPVELLLVRLVCVPVVCCGVSGIAPSVAPSAHGGCASVLSAMFGALGTIAAGEDAWQTVSVEVYIHGSMLERQETFGCVAT